MGLARFRTFQIISILVLGLGSWLLLRGFDAAPSELERLQSRYARGVAGERPVEGRLSWELPYAAFEPEPAVKRLAEQSVDRLEARIGLERLAREQESPATLAVVAVVDLLEGETDAAVTRLERTVDLAPNDAAVLSDLAAAYLARARRNDSPYDIVLALESAERALLADPDSIPARFNVAVALERLHLLDAAADEWKAYVGIDQGGGWAEEATRRAERLVSRPVAMSWDEAKSRLEDAAAGKDASAMQEAVREFPRRSMEHAVVELLGGWADAFLSEEAGTASERLRTAQLVAEALEHASGDTLAREANGAIRRAGPDALSLLTRGHQALRDGKDAFAGGNREAARRLLTQARGELNRGGSPGQWLAAYELARCDYRLENDRLLSILDSAASELLPLSYPLLEGKIAWLVGMTHLGFGKPAEALSRYRHALRAFIVAGDERGQAAIQTLLAEAYQYLGARYDAWGFHISALQGLDLFVDDPRRSHTALLETARSLQSDQHATAARFVWDELVRRAERWGHVGAAIEARTQRSRNWLLLEQFGRAQEDLETALGWLPGIKDPDRREPLRADLLAGRARLLTPTQPEEALTDLSEALGFFAESQVPFRTTELYAERARLLIALGRKNLARKDLEAGIRAVERQRANLSDSVKVSWFDQSRALFEALVALLVDAGDVDGAFGVVERSRARSLLDARRTPGTSTLASIRRALDDGATLIEYFSLENRLLAWVVRRDRTDFLELDVARSELKRLVTSLESSILRLELSITDPASALYDAVLRGPLAAVDSGAVLIVVPGTELARVPFAALLNRESGRYLVEDHSLGIAPSATLFAGALGQDRQLFSREGVLVLANPKFSVELFPSFPNLPHAEVEGRTVASIYPDAELLTGMRATKSRLLAAAGQARIVHFAGHSIANEREPRLSLLVVAEDTDHGERGTLYGYEVAAADWRGTELVVLSSCSGAAGPGSPTEGVLSLGRAFLIGGASAVLANLWPVDDAATAHFFEAFHRRLETGDSPYSALRTAQVGFIRSTDGALQHPFAWAGFSVVGVQARTPNKDHGG